MKRALTAFRTVAAVSALVLGLSTGRLAAQTKEASPEEVVAYQAWYLANAAKDVPKATEAAKAYLKQFPEGGNSAYLKNWLNQARGGAFTQAIKSGNVEEMLRIGREVLAENPNDLSYLISLSVNLRKTVLLAGQKNATWESAAGEYSKKAISLIDGGAVPPGTDPAKWSKDATLAVLHQTAAIAAQKDNRSDEALKHYETSLKLAPTQSAVASYNGFYCGKLRKDKYDAAVTAYQALPEESRTAAQPGDAVKAALAEVNAQADATVECWAAFAAATEKTNPFGDTRATIQQALTALWQSRHPSDAAGLETVIAKYRAAN